jgi:oligopeptide/dipeptide ABC transporter ATP-binding protein
MASRPRLGERSERLRAIGGHVPDPLNFPAACRFHPRCPIAIDVCRRVAPALAAFADDRRSRCWRSGEVLAGTVDAVEGARA